MDISDSRAVIRLVERPHTTCSFQVTSAITHKTWYRKVVAMHFGFITRPSYLEYSLAERIGISDSRAIVQYVKRRYTTFNFRIVCVIVHKIVYL